MKTNLKTFPKPNEKGFYISNRVTTWKENFTKELQQLIKTYGQQPVYFEDVIKEILGE